MAISAEAAAKFKKLGIADPAARFLGKTIRVKGCVMRFEVRPYLPVHDPKQISVVEKKQRSLRELDACLDPAAVDTGRNGVGASGRSKGPTEK